MTLSGRQKRKQRAERQALGLCPYCGKCETEQKMCDSCRQWTRDYGRKRYQNDPEYRTRVQTINREKQREYRATPECRAKRNTSEYRAMQLARYHNDPEYRARQLERSRERYGSEPEYRAKCIARVHQHRHHDGSWTSAEWAAMLAQYRNHCACCGEIDLLCGALQADHIVPVNHGGHSVIENLQPLCQPCNASKHDRIAPYICVCGRSNATPTERLFPDLT